MDCPTKLVAHGILLELNETVEVIKTYWVSLNEVEVDIVDSLLDVLESAVEIPSGICVITQELSVSDNECLLSRALIDLPLSLLSS